MARKTTVPTMKDVAEEAGVAIGTVSKVFNGQNVGTEYKKKVLAAAKKLDYKINTYAQGLKSGKTKSIAFLVPNTINQYFGMLTTEVNKALKKHGYKMFLCCTDYDDSQEQEFITMASLNKVDGIIGLTYNPKLVIEEGIPFISIDRIISPSIPCVASDNYAGGVLAAQTLYNAGCRKVCFLRTGSTLSNEPDKRKSGFENECIAKGLDYDMKIIDDSTSHNVFFEYLKSHISNGKIDFDGIFCVTDTLALEVIDMLKQTGIKTPEDVQIIGFDGLKPYEKDEYFCSTIVQSVDQIAEMAVTLLLQDSDTMKPPLVCLPVKFAYGGTTKKSFF
ncbi:MAG: LacI family DNA-binding transcriptional regulator [Treponema sp.]|nr:LacI family DNA-binding transcriptional regulator [Treponema sp.]